MTRSKLSRTALGAALTVALSTFAFTPAFAAPAAPVVAFSGAIADGAVFTYGEVPAAPTCTATAVETAEVTTTCEVTGYQTTVGTHVLTATGTATSTVDQTFTTTTATLTYTVKGWQLKGFYSPVKAGTITRKAGSTIPFKFKVYVDGVKEKSPDVVAGFVAQPVNCSTRVPEGTAIQLTTAKLKYRDGAFHQNWKTPKLTVTKVKGKKITARACYDVLMTTQDGSSIKALVTLK